MPKCQCADCSNPAIWAWQPFGPSFDGIGTLTSFGYHYRGFPVIKICYEHYTKLKSNEGEIRFIYKKRDFCFDVIQKKIQ